MADRICKKCSVRMLKRCKGRIEDYLKCPMWKAINQMEVELADKEAVKK